MSFFSPNQIKLLLVSWPLVLFVLFMTAVIMSFSALESNVGADATLLASFFVMIAAQITTIIYFAASAVLLALWFFGGRQQNLLDYALVMIAAALILGFFLRDTNFAFWQS